jgi:hypothetical protein
MHKWENPLMINTTILYSPGRGGAGEVVAPMSARS